MISWKSLKIKLCEFSERSYPKLIHIHIHAKQDAWNAPIENIKACPLYIYVKNHHIRDDFVDVWKNAIIEIVTFNKLIFFGI